MLGLRFDQLDYVGTPEKRCEGDEGDIVYTINVIVKGVYKNIIIVVKDDDSDGKEVELRDILNL